MWMFIKCFDVCAFFVFCAGNYNLVFYPNEVPGGVDVVGAYEGFEEGDGDSGEVPGAFFFSFGEAFGTAGGFDIAVGAGHGAAAGFLS